MVFDKVREREWFELPPAIGGPKLFRRATSCARRIFMTPKSRRMRKRGVCAGGRGNGAHERRYVQRSDVPAHGEPGMRFGRNVPLGDTIPDTANLMNPNPRTVSLELLTRTKFKPCDVPERAGGSVDSVSGARLVRSQEGSLGAHPRHSRRRQRHRGTSVRCACR